MEGVDHDTDTAESAGPYKAKHGSHNIVNPHLYRFNWGDKSGVNMFKGDAFVGV